MTRKYTPQQLDTIGRTDPSRLLDIADARARRRVESPDRSTQLAGHLVREGVKCLRADLRSGDAPL